MTKLFTIILHLSESLAELRVNMDNIECCYSAMIRKIG